MASAARFVATQARKDSEPKGPKVRASAAPPQEGEHGQGPDGTGGHAPVEEESQEAPPTGFWKFQPKAAAFYMNLKVQIFVAVLIGGNFMTNIVEKTIDPTGLLYEDTWAGFELFYNVMFTIELMINMYAFWLCNFWKSGWNVFDFVVVTIGLCTTFKVPLPGPFSMLRMMRAFRVFRLFKRIKSLNKIMTSLVKAIPGVVNAFVILFLVMCIYAILAVDFFKDYGQGTGLRNEDGKFVPYMTARGSDYGYEYFGNFMKSLYTMFQVLTGESWSEAVARPLLHGESLGNAIFSALFFSSFVLVCGVVLINVVVAVLLEKMVDDPTAEEDGEGDTEEPGEEPPVDDAFVTENFVIEDPAPLEAAVAAVKADMNVVKDQLMAIQAMLQPMADLENKEPNKAGGDAGCGVSVRKVTHSTNGDGCID